MARDRVLGARGSQKFFKVTPSFLKLSTEILVLLLQRQKLTIYQKLKVTFSKQYLIAEILRAVSLK